MSQFPASSLVMAFSSAVLGLIVLRGALSKAYSSLARGSGRHDGTVRTRVVRTTQRLATATVVAWASRHRELSEAL